METADLHPLLEDLTDNIDDLEDALGPLLQSTLSQSTSKLPLLDKAKVYVLLTYAIESLLFSSLRLAGVDAKAHPVFQELARVKNYFAKIKAAETAGAKRTSTLDREAAGRLIKHGLAGNERLDREREVRVERERAGPKRKLEMMGTGTHTRFEGAAKRMRDEEDVSTSLSGTGASTPVVKGEGSELMDVLVKAKAEKRAARRLRKLEKREQQGDSEAGVLSAVSGGDNAVQYGSREDREDEGEEEVVDSSPVAAAASEATLQSSSTGGASKTAKRKKKKKTS